MNLGNIDLKNIEITREGSTGAGAGPIVVATISRPEALNALNADSLRSLAQLIEIVDADPTARVLVLTGKGEKAFVAGADIKGFEAMSPGDALKFAKDGQAVFSGLEKMSKPVIAAVNGFALGGGLELALACDMIVASEKAKFGLPECKLGLIPGFGGTVRLPRRVGTAKALELSMTGAMISADQALLLGLVVRVVPHGEALKSALETAALMVQQAPLALKSIKKSVHEGRGHSVAAALEIEATLFGEIFKTQDKNEGVRAFIEGRQPKFEGR